MNKRVKGLALAGVGAAVSLVFIVLGYYVDVLTVSFNVFATGGMMLTLSKGYYKESILSWVAAGGLGFLFCNVGAIPFIMIGGAYSIFTIIAQEKNLKLYIKYPVTIAYSCLVFFIFYKFTTYLVIDMTALTFLQNVAEWKIYVVMNVAFVVLMLLYDYCLLFCYKWLKAHVFSKIK